MVNFKRLISHSNQPALIEPRALFQTLQRDKKFEYLRDVQGDVLDEWFLRRAERDLVIKMNTGSGKTLVGLIVLWSRLKEGNGPALYLCPDRYLVSQVRREADRLGINQVDFGPENQFPSEFHDSSAILITTVQRLFNGLSVFRVAAQPNPVKVGAILIDDAHTCINISRQQFTASFSKDSEVGRRIYSFFLTTLQQQSVGLCSDIERGDRNSYIRVPYWAWQERLPDVAELFSSHSDSDELRFVWPFLRHGDVLANSVAVISGDRVEVAPAFLPVELVPSFDTAPHKIYMSATLVDDAALIRDFAAEPKSVLQPIKPKVAGDIGERLIITPSLVDSRIDEGATINLVSDIQGAHQVNVVVLVPSTYRSRVWIQKDTMQVPGDDISTVIDKLSNSTSNTAVFAYRYDGIDLPDEACRVLVLHDLPQELSLVNLSEATARHQSPILKRQIAQRIEQGMGRGVRSRTDHCVVILMGRNLVSFMSQVENQSFFTAETKKQIEIGKKVCGILKEQNTNSYQAILDLASQCLNRDADWQTYHKDAVQEAEENREVSTTTISLAAAELQAWKYALNGQYQRAADEITSLINEDFQWSDLDKGWYLQLGASYLYHSDRVNALQQQLKAHELNPNLLKPPDGVNYRKIQSRHTKQAQAVLEQINRFTEPNALVAEANLVFDSLTFGVPHNAFEQAFDDLARIIGFQSQRPDKETGRGPDILWRMTNGHYLVVEAKNQVKVDREQIYKTEAEQLGHHVTWFTQTYVEEPFTPIIIHPSDRLAFDAFVPEGSKVIQPDNLQRIVDSVRSFVAALATKPSNQWAAPDVAAQIAAYELRPTDFLDRILTKGMGRGPQN